MADQWDGFYEARTARNIAMGNGSGDTTVMTEVNALRVAINTAVIAGKLTVTIVGTTPITSYDNYNGQNTSSYYDEWAGMPTTSLTQDQKDTRQKSREIMLRAIGYLNRLGYTCSRSRDGSNNRLQLIVSW